MDFIDGILNFFDIIGVHAVLWGPVLGVMLLWTLAILCVPMCIAGIILGIKFCRRYRRRGTLFIIGSVIAIPLCVFYISWLINAEMYVGFVRPPHWDPSEIEIDEHSSHYFIVGNIRYEALEITQTYVYETNEWNALTYYYDDGFTEAVYDQVPNSEGYDIVKSFGGKLYCRAEQKAEIIEFLSDTEHPVWYGIRTDGNTHRLSDELVAEVLDFCKSAEGTEEIYLSDCKNITLTKTIGGIIDQGSVFLQLYGGQAYYGVDGAMAPLPADLSNRLVTALDD